MTQVPGWPSFAVLTLWSASLIFHQRHMHEGNHNKSFAHGYVKVVLVQQQLEKADTKLLYTCFARWEMLRIIAEI